jgi:glycosyltransferase involved in cell wall biosynthesis
MKISALLAAFNTERYVAAAVTSILAQTSPAFEIIAVDDGSSDGTAAALRAFGDRIRLIELPHLGAPQAFNAALAAASGELLAFNDADDLWAPTKLATQATLLATDPDLDAVFGAVQQFVSPDWVAGAVEPTMSPQAGVNKIGMLIRRSAFERVGSFDASFQYCEFGDWYARALRVGLCVQQHSEIVGYRRLHASNTGRIHRNAARDEHLLALKRSLDARRGLRRE